jgi:subtilisin family serine protease
MHQDVSTKGMCMRRRIAALIVFLSVTLIATLLPAAMSAQQLNSAPPIFFQTPDRMHVAPASAASAARLTVMLQLDDPPALAAPAADIATHRRQIVAKQAVLLQGLSAMGAQVLFQTSLVYNGIAVVAPASQLAALSALPGVAGIHVIPPKQRSNASAVPFVGAPAVWQSRTGITGQGIRIGIVDSGIDYTHADFGGVGTPAAYASNNRTIIEPGSFPTAKVVAGYDFAGDNYDANGVVGSAVPVPDADPLDCNGHGTHVAGTAAGSGVAADGTTYAGPYTADLDVSSFRVGPGVAPEAQLVALKIFGCDGASTLTTRAIEWALDPNGDGNPSDHLDVLNIALGSPFGGPNDPDAVAVDNAVRSGIVVVTAAGDTGNTFYSVDTPASSPSAIAVGASVDAARATAPTTPTDSLAWFTARGPLRSNNTLKPDLVAPGLDIVSAGYGSGNGNATLSGTSMAAAQVAGAAALLRQLNPHWSPALIKAALMDTAAPVKLPNGSPYPPSLAGAGRLDLRKLPALDLLAYADSPDQSVSLMYGAPWLSQPWTTTRQLRLDNQSSSLRTVSLRSTTAVSETGVTLTLPSAPITLAPHSQVSVPVSMTVDPARLDFTADSATPPRQGNFPRYFLAEHGGYIEINGAATSSVRVRPAHAADLISVDFYLDDQLIEDSLDSREVEEYSDTTPGVHTIRLRRPGASPGSTPLFSADTPALLDGHDYTLIVVGRRGALGLVVVDETTPPPPAGQSLIHFVNANRTESNWNIGPIDVYLDGAVRAAALPVGQASEFTPIAPGTHTVWFFQAGKDPAHDKALERKTFSVGAGEIVLVGIGRHNDDGDADNSDFDQRAFVGRSIPRVDLALRVPFTIFPKSASDARAASTTVTVPPGAQTFSVGLHNTGARNTGLSGGVGSSQTPLVSAFELEAISPEAPELNGSLRAADIQYVGVTSNLSVTQQVSQTVIFFGLSSYAPWSTPNEVQFWVYIDSNGVPGDDYVIVNTSITLSDGTTPTDVFVSAFYKILADGTLQPTPFTTSWNTWPSVTSSIANNLDAAPFNTSVLFQAAGAAQIGLDAGHTRFSYHVETRARDADGFRHVLDRVPAVGSLDYDLAQAAIAPIANSPLQRPLFIDVEGGQVSGAVNSGVLMARGVQKLLLLHHHNAPAPRAEVIDIASPMPLQGHAEDFRRLLPVTRR